MNKNHLTLRLSIVLIAILLLLWVIPAKGQYLVEDITALPAANIIECGDCNPAEWNPDLNQKYWETMKAGWNLCLMTGSNDWGQEANEITCGRGQFHVRDEWGNIATWVYNRWSPYDDNTQVGLLYVYLHEPFKVDKT